MVIKKWLYRLKRSKIVKIIKASRIMMPVLNYKKKKYFSSRQKSVAKYGYHLISYFYDLSKELELPIWIFWGTLLGFVREGELLKHDYDMDFVMFTPTKEKKDMLDRHLKRDGFRLIRQFYYGDCLIGEAYDYNGVIFDIDYGKISDGTLILYEYDVDETKTAIRITEKTEYDGLEIYKYLFPKFTLCEGCFRNGIQCVIPQNKEHVVEQMYGANWEIPDYKNDWKALNNFKYLGFKKEARGWSLK